MPTIAAFGNGSFRTYGINVSSKKRFGANIAVQYLVLAGGGGSSGSWNSAPGNVGCGGAGGAGGLRLGTQNTSSGGVFSNEIESVPFVWDIDADSWKKKRLDFVSLTFQVREHLLENQSVRPTSDSTNILPHDISWFDFSNCPEHFGPKMAVIFFSHPFSCGTEGLA